MFSGIWTTSDSGSVLSIFSFQQHFQICLETKTGSPCKFEQTIIDKAMHRERKTAFQPQWNFQNLRKGKVYTWSVTLQWNTCVQLNQTEWSISENILYPARNARIPVPNSTAFLTGFVHNGVHFHFQKGTKPGTKAWNQKQDIRRWDLCCLRLSRTFVKYKRVENPQTYFNQWQPHNFFPQQKGVEFCSVHSQGTIFSHMTLHTDTVFCKTQRKANTHILHFGAFKLFQDIICKSPWFNRKHLYNLGSFSIFLCASDAVY